MKISYAITVCNELEEISRLLNFLHQHKQIPPGALFLCQASSHFLAPKLGPHMACKTAGLLNRCQDRHDHGRR